MAAGEYVPSTWEWVRDQVDKIESTGDTASVSILGKAVVLVTMTGVKSGAVRKVPLMRVEHDGEYALIGSVGGAPKNPGWIYNLRAHPDVAIHDGTHRGDYVVRELSEGDERDAWWARAVAAFGNYAEYQEKTSRRIPVFIASPVPSTAG